MNVTRWGLPLLAAACFIRLWLMALGSSFWTDEMATVFVVEHGAGDPSLRVAPQVPQSVYYAVIRKLVRGRSEIAYRLPSIFFMALALFLVGLLSARWLHPDAGWFAIFACFALKGMNYEAANARPYAMGICVAASGIYFLVRWYDTQRLRDALLFIFFAALLWRVHLIFWPFYLVFALYALARRKDASIGKSAMMFGIVAAALLPVAWRAFELNAEAKEHVVAALPSLLDLFRSLHPLLVAGAGLGAWIWSGFAKPRAAIPASSVVVIVVWWLAQPLALFAFSHITGNSVFVPRYLTLSLPGTAAAATLAAACFLGSQFWRPAALAMGVCALIFAGDFKEVWPAHHNSDWRGAARAIDELGLPPWTPVICPSPFIEARPPAWTPDYKMPGFLYAHLAVYPVRGNVVLFPFANSPEAEDYAVVLLQGALPSARRFVIYGDNGNVHFWTNWFVERPELAGWTHRSLGHFRDVEAVLLSAP